MTWIRDPGLKKIRIRGGKNSDPGSRINIQDPQHYGILQGKSEVVLINKFNVLIVWARRERQVAVLGYVNQRLSYTQLGLQYVGGVISKGREHTD